MSDEQKKPIFSEPPPPTDEIDSDWGDDAQGQSEAGAAGTAQAPLSQPPPASRAAAASSATRDEEDEEDEEDDQESDDDVEEEESDDEEDEGDDEEEESDDEEDEASAQPARDAKSAAASDWIPDWGPYAVLALLVGVSFLVGLGIVGGPPAPEGEETAEPVPSAAAPAIRSPHP